jgi:hypothetical protein
VGVTRPGMNVSGGPGRAANLSKSTLEQVGLVRDELLDKDTPTPTLTRPHNDAH